MIPLIFQPEDLEKQITMAWAQVGLSRSKEAYNAAYMRFATLIGLRRQPKVKKFAHECRNIP
jgi:hypothetical protein